MSIEAMRQALEALELHGQQYPHMVKGYCLDAITALRTAIEQADKHEPVAWIDWDEEGWAFLTTESCGVPVYRAPLQQEEELRQLRKQLEEMTGLFHLQSQRAHDYAGMAMRKREWVGLSNEFYERLAEQHVTNSYFDTLTYAKAIEAKLRQNNV